jgi:hypothetical protein
LPDAFVRELISTGQADILVGIPTLNHATSAGRVAHTVHQLFSTVYARQRTVLVNPDGGSTDGTQAAILSSGAIPSDLIVTSFQLRTLHRITTPYHGVPGRGSAMRLIFAAADLLNVRAVLVISPEAIELSVADMAALISPVLERGADYVKPVVPRAPHDGPLVTQLVRPLLGAVFGPRIREPIDPLLACSAGFARRALKSALWETAFAQYGLDPWLGALAALEGFALAQARVHVQHPKLQPRLEFADVFQQVVGSVFSVTAREAARWLPITQSYDVPITGEQFAAAPNHARFDIASSSQALRQGVDALAPLLAEFLKPDTLGALQAAARSSDARIDDALWISTVYEFVASAAGGVLSVDQLVQALRPIYLGRLATMLQDLTRSPAADRHDPHLKLALEFERRKTELVAAWPALPRGDP